MRSLPSARERTLARIASSAGDANSRRFDDPGRFQSRQLRQQRRQVEFLPQWIEVYGAYRWGGRRASRLRDRVHVRRLSASAIFDRDAGRTLAGVGDRVGHEATRERRAAVVFSVSWPENHGARFPALDGYRSELELHVRRLSFDQLAQELRRSHSD